VFTVFFWYFFAILLREALGYFLVYYCFGQISTSSVEGTRGETNMQAFPAVKTYTTLLFTKSRFILIKITAYNLYSIFYFICVLA